MVQNDFNIIKEFIKPPKQEPEHTAYIENAFKKGKGWSFDLKIGDEYFLSGNDEPQYLKEESQFIIIKPGKFGSLITKEKVCIPNKYIGLISVKFSFKQKGLINVSGFHVDPCYKGNIIFTVFNAGPKDIYIKRDSYVFMICFLELSQSLEDIKNNVDNNRFEDIASCGDTGCGKKEGYYSIPINMIDGFGGTSLTLMENNRRIEKLEFYIKIMSGVAIGLIALSLRGLFTP